MTGVVGHLCYGIAAHRLTVFCTTPSLAELVFWRLTADAENIGQSHGAVLRIFWQEESFLWTALSFSAGRSHAADARETSHLQFHSLRKCFPTRPPALELCSATIADPESREKMGRSCDFSIFKAYSPSVCRNTAL